MSEQKQLPPPRDDESQQQSSDQQQQSGTKRKRSGAARDTETPKKERKSGPRGRRTKPLTPEQREAAQDIFLTEFSKSANVRASCMIAGIGRATLYRWLEHDVPFTVRYHEAEKDANDVVRGAIFQRAVIGTRKPLHYHGQLVTDAQGNAVTVVEQSDSLLMFLAKSRMPEFRDKQQVDIHATVDIQGAADEADRRWSRFLSTVSNQQPDGEKESIG